MISRHSRFMGIGFAIALVASACSGSTSTPSPAATNAPTTAASVPASVAPSAAACTGKSIAHLPRAINIPYFDAAFSGIKEAAAELGDTVKEVGPSENTAASQLPYIQTLTEQKVDGIVLAANDQNALLPSLKTAQDAGVKVVTYDADTAPAGRPIFVSQATPDSIGRGELKVMAELIGYKGKFAIIASSATSPNEAEWIKGMKAELADAKYKDMTLTEEAYGQDEPASFDTATGLMQKYPDLAGIIGTNSYAISATARAVETAGKAKKVIVTGLGTPNDMRKYVKDGTAPKFILWSPKDMGYLATYALQGVMCGTLTGAKGETFTAGRLGKYTIEDAGLVTTGLPTVFDASNIDQFDF